MAYQQVGLRVKPQQLERLDKFAKKRFESNRSTAVRWLAMRMLDQIEGLATSDTDIKPSLPAAPGASGDFAAKIAQLEKKVEVLQRQVGPTSIF